LGIAEQRRKITVRSSEDCLSLLKVKYLQKVSSAADVIYRVAPGVAEDGLEECFFWFLFLWQQRKGTRRAGETIDEMIPKRFLF